MVCLCNIWFGHLFGISMKICQCQIQTHGCYLTPGHRYKGEMEECVLKHMLPDDEYLKKPEDWESFISGRKQRAEVRFSQAKVQEHSEEAACLERNFASSRLSQMCWWYQGQG